MVSYVRSTGTSSFVMSFVDVCGVISFNSCRNAFVLSQPLVDVSVPLSINFFAGWVLVLFRQ